VAQALDVSMERLPFAGELMEVRPEFDDWTSFIGTRGSLSFGSRVYQRDALGNAVHISSCPACPSAFAQRLQRSCARAASIPQRPCTPFVGSPRTCSPLQSSMLRLNRGAGVHRLRLDSSWPHSRGEPSRERRWTPD
jgi:hypothetical protein